MATKSWIVAATLVACASSATAQELIGINSNGSTGAIVSVDEGAGYSSSVLHLTGNPSGYSGMAITPDGRTWVSDRQGNFSELDSATGAVLSTIQLGTQTSDLAAHPTSGLIYTIDELAHLRSINPYTGVVTQISDDSTGTPAPGRSGGLACSLDGTVLYHASSIFGELRTIDASTGALLQIVGITGTLVDGLAVRPTDGVLLGTARFGGSEIVEIDPLTGVATVVGTTTHGAHLSDLDYMPNCPPATTASVTSRPGTPANPDVFTSGSQTPVLGTDWAPSIDHSTFMTGALFDFAGVSVGTDNLTTPYGTLLCQLPMSGFQTVTPGTSFSFPVPLDCMFAGVSLCVAAGSADATSVELTNALDIVIGNN